MAHDVKAHPWYQVVDSKEKAQFVRKLRVDDGYTWRAVARDCSLAWNGDWDSNQIAGMYICYAAADLLGENASVEPWN